MDLLYVCLENCINTHFFVDVSEDFSCNFVQNIYCGSNYGKSDKKALTIYV